MPCRKSSSRGLGLTDSWQHIVCGSTVVRACSQAIDLRKGYSITQGHSAPQKAGWWHYEGLNRIKLMRRIATRYGKMFSPFMGVLNVVAVRLWIGLLSTR